MYDCYLHPNYNLHKQFLNNPVESQHKLRVQQSNFGKCKIKFLLDIKNRSHRPIGDYHMRLYLMAELSKLLLGRHLEQKVSFSCLSNVD